MRLPNPPTVGRRSGLPVLAMVAPVLVAGVLWAVTSSVYMLLFAFLGPVVAVAGWLDGRRTARRDTRASLDDASRRLVEMSQRIDARAAERRRRLELAAPPLAALIARDERPESPIVFRLGSGTLPSGLELADADTEQPPELVPAIAALRARAAHIRDAPVLIDEAEADITVSGPRVLVRAFARALVLQAAASCAAPEALVLVPDGETWTGELPHAVQLSGHWEVRHGDRRVVRIRSDERGASPGAVRVRMGDESAGPPRVEAPHRVDDFRPVLVCSAEARLRARELAERARSSGWHGASELPTTVELRSLEDVPRETGATLSAVIGRDADGPVHLDLEREGPHALVAGTTGSGKSELLVSWVLALAHAHPPDELGFLLVDFKGGASFAPLEGLPHVVGMVSDLDPITAARAVESLRAELRRREQSLATHGVRSIDELPRGTLARLVIVVDEFAALVSLAAELHQVFADLAARGRSLGLHLVVCTQRPAGVVRESMLANITLRICLRVLDAADSVAVVGSAAAATIPAAARGRGLLVAGAGATPVQFAISAPSDAAGVRARWANAPRPAARPWLDPLPALIRSDELPALLDAASPSAAGAVIGALDLPDRQRREPLAVDPWGSGALIVLGSAGSGRTTALAMLASVVDAEVRWVPDDPAELWQALQLPAGDRRVLVIADDLDRTLAWVDAEQRADLTELIGRVAHDARRSGVAVAASARPAAGGPAATSGVFEQRILLRTATRDEHLLAGGELTRFRADRRPGSALWRGDEAQLAVPATLVAEPWRAALPEVQLTDGSWAIATPRPAALLARLAAAGFEASAPAGDARLAPITVADVDGWLADHAALTAVRRTGRLLLTACTSADHRSLTRLRSALPPLGSADEAWLVDGGTTTRVLIRQW